MRLIDAEALIDEINEMWKIHPAGLENRKILSFEAVIDLIGAAPTIEAKPVVSARWELDSVIDSPYCSNCGKEALRDYFEDEVRSNYCPHCGAQMDEPFPQAHENGMKGE